MERTEHIVFAALVILLAVVVGGWLARILGGRVPLPLVQVGLGGLLAAGTDLGLALEPEIFFLVFLPPLLFLDGWRIPKDVLVDNLGPVLELSLGLVVASVLAIGALLHWMIPAMPLAVAFALAAVLAPTDPVAIGATIERARMPRRLLLVLEGESLLNDASGLVCMRFAVLAATTGALAPATAAATFVWLTLVGVACGAGLTLAVTALQDRVSERIGEEPGSKILVGLLLPFGAYLLAEYLGGSGVLAAVAAGIALSYAERSGRALPVTRVRRAAVWDTIRLALNGAMFVVVGEQLPAIVVSAAAALRASNDSPFLIPLHVLAVTLGLVLLRVGWFRASLLLRGRDRVAIPPRHLWIAAFAGVRGSITVAGAFSLPLLSGGLALPARDLAIVIAAGAVILSLTLGAIALPPLLRGVAVAPEDPFDASRRHAREAAARAAVAAIEAAVQQEHDFSSRAIGWTDAAARIASDYLARIDGLSRFGSEPGELRRARKIDRTLRLAALGAERRTYDRLARERALPEEAARQLAAEIDQAEAGVTGPQT